MRKLALLTTALVAAFAMAAVAVAQTSSYDVDAKLRPAKAGSKKNPVPVGVSFSLAADSGTNRPTTARRFELSLEGVRANGQAFPRCTFAEISQANSDAGCSKRARIGRGVVKNLAGNTADQTDTSITCNLAVTLYNGGKNKVTLFLQGGPTGYSQFCQIPLTAAIAARWVKDGKHAMALRFDIPQNLQNPVAGVSNAIRSISANLNRRTVRRGGKRVGYLESVGCQGKTRSVVLTTTSAGGGTITGRTTLRC